MSVKVRLVVEGGDDIKTFTYKNNNKLGSFVFSSDAVSYARVASPEETTEEVVFHLVCSS